ncbi:MAG: hypothetical protein ACK5Z2_05015 [Bacteroidota bacterium]
MNENPKNISLIQMRTVISFLLLFCSGLLSAQSPAQIIGKNWGIGFSGGLTAFSKPYTDRGSSYFANGHTFGFTVYRNWEQQNLRGIRLQLGIRYEKTGAYRLELGSVGGTITMFENEQTAYYITPQLVRTFTISNLIYIPIILSGNFTLDAKHSGYMYSRIQGNEQYEYYTNTNDSNRRDAYAFIGAGIGFNISESFHGELILHMGNSATNKFKYTQGIMAQMNWRFGIKKIRRTN